MKIAIIGPGLMEIPPKGWGAVELIIHEYSTELKKNGWDVLVVNTPDKAEIVAKVNSFKPDFVHCQYDEHIDIMDNIECPAKAITSHYGYLDQVWKFPDYRRKIHAAIVHNKNVLIFALSNSIAEVYRQDGVGDHRLFVTPNGVQVERFRMTDHPRQSNRSIYLAKIDYRKRQGTFQSYDCQIDFAGNLCPHSAVASGFDPSRPDYLGEWSRESVNDKMTDYANLVLLSDGEAHPLVCMEAMAAGLGLVLSQYAAANLDLSKPFIDVIPEDKIHDRDYVRRVIQQNRVKSLEHRQEIRDYAAQFESTHAIRRYMNVVASCCERKTKPRTISEVPVKPKLAIVTVATGKYYDLFFRDLEVSILDKIAPNFDVKIYCFTDHQGPASPRTELCPTCHFVWPFDTLLRFHLMAGILDRLMTHDFVLYMDSDMAFQEALDPKIVDANLAAVQHPEYYWRQREGTYEIDQEASTFVPWKKRKTYVQRCLFGGKPIFFKELLLTLTEKIDRDLDIGKVPINHDESYLNWFFADFPFQVLSPAHAFPEGWAVPIPFDPIILHRAKKGGITHGTNLPGVSAAKIVGGLSLQEQVECSRLLYLRAHEKTQRLERRLLRHSRAEEKKDRRDHLSKVLRAFPRLLRKGISLSRRIYSRISPVKKAG